MYGCLPWAQAAGSGRDYDVGIFDSMRPYNLVSLALRLRQRQSRHSHRKATNAGFYALIEMPNNQDGVVSFVRAPAEPALWNGLAVQLGSTKKARTSCGPRFQPLRKSLPVFRQQ